MEKIFQKSNCVILSFIVSWILGFGCKTPEEAKSYIKYGKTLSPSYYPENQKSIELNGEEKVYLQFMERLFNENNINTYLTEIIGENVYTPWDCLSGIYKIKINENMGLVARPDGITKNNECVIMVDNYLTKTYCEEELKIKLLSTMAVWKAKKGVYIITKMNKQINMDFDDSMWENILYKIQLWNE